MWLQRHLPHAQILSAGSTSSAVQIAKKTPGVAAVASPIAAEYYGMPVVVANIQDKPDNTTRFFVIGKQASGSAGGGRDMTSFLISLGDDAASGAGVFDRHIPAAEVHHLGLEDAMCRVEGGLFQRFCGGHVGRGHRRSFRAVLLHPANDRDSAAAGSNRQLALR